MESSSNSNGQDTNNHPQMDHAQGTEGRGGTRETNSGRIEKVTTSTMREVRKGSSQAENRQ